MPPRTPGELELRAQDRQRCAQFVTGVCDTRALLCERVLEAAAGSSRSSAYASSFLPRRRLRAHSLAG
jgi:hypothetical protein